MTDVRWSDEALTEAGEQTVWMSPDDYLKLAPKMEKKPWESAKGKDLQQSIEAGDEVYELPSLTVKKGMVTAQDGRHRALAAKEAGIRMIPVQIIGDRIASDREIMGMQGGKVKLQGRPRAWEEVVRDPEFRRLPPEEREAARQEYFNEVVAPRLPATDVEQARAEFAEDTRTRRAPRTLEAETAPDPTEGVSSFELGRAGVGRALVRTGVGAGQLARDVLEGTLGGGEGSQPAKFGKLEAPPIGERVSNILGLPTPQSIAERQAREAPLMETTAGQVGDIVGNALLAAPLVMAPGANTILGSALYGGAYGATQPAGSWAERGQNVAAAGATSGAVTGGARALPAFWRGFGAPMLASGREGLALDTLGRFQRDPNAVRNALSRPAPTGAPAIDELIPGSRATLAEVTGDPGLAQAQRVAQAASPDVASEIAALRTSRIEARKNALLTQFGVGNKQALEATRDSIAERLYRQAWNDPIDPAVAKNLRPEVRSLLARPSIQKARSEAMEIAREEGEILRPSDIKGVGSVKGLHYMKKALDREIERTKTADPIWSSKVVGTQRKLLDVIDELSPSYKQARAEYAKASKPVNQAEIGAYLYDKLFPALSDVGAERITPQQFAKAVKEGNAMARRATGFSGAKLKDILTTDQWNTLINMARDIGRETGALERGRVPGSPTAQYLSGRNVLKQILGPAGLPESWAEKMTADLLSNKWTSMIASPVERDVQNRLAMLLADPRQAVAAQARRDAAQRGVLPRTANALTRYALPPVSGTAGLTAAGGQ
jgi:hypothetical protein